MVMVNNTLGRRLVKQFRESYPKNRKKFRSGLVLSKVRNWALTETFNCINCSSR